MFAKSFIQNAEQHIIKTLTHLTTKKYYVKSLNRDYKGMSCKKQKNVKTKTGWRNKIYSQGNMPYLPNIYIFNYSPVIRWNGQYLGN